MGKLAEVAVLFLRLGFTAFGGPASHISAASSSGAGAALAGLFALLAGAYLKRREILAKFLR